MSGDTIFAVVVVVVVAHPQNSARARSLSSLFAQGRAARNIKGHQEEEADGRRRRRRCHPDGQSSLSQLLLYYYYAILLPLFPPAFRAVHTKTLSIFLLERTNERTLYAGVTL